MVEVVLRTEKGRRSSPKIKFITLLLPALVSPVHQNNPKQRYFLLFYQEHVKKNVECPVKGKTFFFFDRGGGRCWKILK